MATKPPPPRPLPRLYLATPELDHPSQLVASLPGLLAGAIVAGVAFEAGRRRQSPAEGALLLGLSRGGSVLVGLGLALVLGFGLGVGPPGHWGYGSWRVTGPLG